MRSKDQILLEQQYSDNVFGKEHHGEDNIEDDGNMESLGKIYFEINKVIDDIDPNLSHEGFAKIVSAMIKNEYGSHNIKPFLLKLAEELQK
jgi:hypothetical protein